MWVARVPVSSHAQNEQSIEGRTPCEMCIRDRLECGWEVDDIRQSKFPVLERANVLGWFDGGRLVSQIAVYPMRMNICLLYTS